MFQVFEGDTANEVWCKIASNFRAANDVELRPSRAGRVLDIGNVCLSIADARQRWVVSREPAINPAFAIAEIVWIMNGRNDAEFLNYFNRQLPRFAGSLEHYPGAYGYRLRANLGFDQLDRAHSALQKESGSRQVVLQIWDGRSDLPCHDGTPSSTDVPCNIVSMLKVRDGRLDWTQILRSNDVFLGLPHNIIQFTTLQEVLAGWLGVKCGVFHLVTDSLHLYEKDRRNFVMNEKDRVQLNTDSLSFERSCSEASFCSLAQFVDLIIDPSVIAKDIFTRAAKCDLPAGYQNLRYVLAAEGLRRRQDYCLASEIMRACDNPLLIQVWSRWIQRLRDQRESNLRSCEYAAQQSISKQEATRHVILE